MVNASIVEASRSEKSVKTSSGMHEASNYVPRLISILSNLRQTSHVKVSKLIGRHLLKSS